MAARGALKAAARPAAAPAASSPRMSSRSSLSASEMAAAIEAPMWIVGPSRPATSPDDRPSTPPTNLTGRMRRQRTVRSPSIAPSISCTPLPAASGATRRVRKKAATTPAAAMAAARAIVSGPLPKCATSHAGQCSSLSTVRWKAAPTTPPTRPQKPAMK